MRRRCSSRFVPVGWCSTGRATVGGQHADESGCGNRSREKQAQRRAHLQNFDQGIPLLGSVLLLAVVTVNGIQHGRGVLVLLTSEVVPRLSPASPAGSMEDMPRNPETDVDTDLDTATARLGEEDVTPDTPAVRTAPAGARPTTAAIWRDRPDLDRANRMSAGCAIGHLGIELTEIGAHHLIGRMPVDRRTRQPFGILHGGATVLLAETLVSCAATFVAAPGTACVGMEINANHLRPVTSGWVTGTAQPVSLGRRSQVWEVRIVDDDDKLVCISRCTMAVIDAA